MNLGKAIKTARGNIFTQKEIASVTGVTNIFVSFVETGKRECSISWLRKFSLAVNIPVPVIFIMAMDDEDSQFSTSGDYDEIKNQMNFFVNKMFGANV